jgi:menaquinone-dependent protoporphyrinogen oxidase
MPNTILITYASRAGSTAEIAEAIAKTLGEAGGMQVDVIPMKDVKDLSPYQAVVVGSAIRGSKWLPEAVEFIQAQQSSLAQKKVAMFTVCITMAMKNAENYRSGVMNWVAPMRAVIKPISEGLFAGRLDFSKLPVNKDTLGLRLSVALGIFPRGDHRDWNAIRSWAESLKPILE